MKATSVVHRSVLTKQYCVFTSAGDNSNVASWVSPDGDRQWDLIIAFYGRDEAAYQALAAYATIIIRCAGAKFQNLKAIAAQQPGLFLNYEYIWVADDDLTFITGDVSQLFETASQYGFKLCQPAFDSSGRISHSITSMSSHGCLARLVNFVEVTCPLFETTALLDFLFVLDPSLVSWGTDWWFSQRLGKQWSHRIAVIDTVVVLNPLDHQRPGGMREIEQLLGADARHQLWLDISQSYKLHEFEHKVLAEIFAP